MDVTKDPTSNPGNAEGSQPAVGSATGASAAATPNPDEKFANLEKKIGDMDSYLNTLSQKNAALERERSVLDEELKQERFKREQVSRELALSRREPDPFQVLEKEIKEARDAGDLPLMRAKEAEYSALEAKVVAVEGQRDTANFLVQTMTEKLNQAERKELYDMIYNYGNPAEGFKVAAFEELRRNPTALVRRAKAEALLKSHESGDLRKSHYQEFTKIEEEKVAASKGQASLTSGGSKPPEVVPAETKPVKSYEEDAIDNILKEKKKL